MAKEGIYGVDLFGESIKPDYKNVISQRFIIPPFSVLNTREGFWQKRKRAWKSIGIKSEVGRNISDRAFSKYEEEKYGSRKSGHRGGGSAGDGGSIFDPVLTELMYTWFCPQGGQVVDPFAGGSVRGIVAVMLDYKYWGCDLSEKQIEANFIQAKEICPRECPSWIIGDSMEKLTIAPDADFIFSCPPYGDLEVYSDDPRDISNMEYHTFKAAYKRIIMQACKKLKNNRFACFVVGDFRDKKGHYRNFVSDTINAFLEQGLYLYNDAILINVVGSLPIRITKQFNSGRKMGKVHQNILVFIKGDWREAVRNITNNEATNV